MILRSNNIPQNEEDLDLGKITKQNTDRNKEYRCELDVVVVRKNIPKPPTNSHIPVLKQRSGKETETINFEEKAENSVEKHVRWDDVNLVQVSSPLVKHSPISAKEKRNPPIDSLGNVLNADASLTPIVKRGVKVTVKQVKYKGED
ncbi:24535_t:CDS:2 [Dentiscutata erythropus]|uniref:24535_t:CDS:1 n=1 Tax=Dentiscutata erythropus TaxID=1348616 RepID=A0A9N9GUK5_9GLOM|nr:24535_t:CDS:2 [Dentiscutata erythropus]